MRAKSLLLSTAAVALPIALLVSPARAQQAALDLPEEQPLIDDLGVSLKEGDFNPQAPSISIGGENGLEFRRYRAGGGWRHNYLITLTKGQEVFPNIYEWIVSVGGQSVLFWGPEGFTNLGDRLNRGNILDVTSDGYRFTDVNGTVIELTSSLPVKGNTIAVGTNITELNGKVTDLHYRSDNYPVGNGTAQKFRLQSVTTNNSYQIDYDYKSNSLSTSTVSDWVDLSKVTAVNNAAEYCDPTADSCVYNNIWPTITYTEAQAGNQTIESHTDILGRETRFRMDDSSRIVGVQHPTENFDGTYIVYDSNSRVSYITLQGQYTRNYTWTGGSSGPVNSVQTSDSLGRGHDIEFNTAIGQIRTYADATGEGYTNYHDGSSRLYRRVATNGITTDLTWSGGVVTEVRHKVAGQPDIVTSATYHTTNPNFVTSCGSDGNVLCNKPLTTTDANGNVTTYTYDLTHGGLTKVERPADENGDRPTTEISYGAFTARAKNAGGSLINQTGSIILPVETTSCRTDTTCPGTVNEQVAQTLYDNGSSPNLNPVSITAKAGNDTDILTTAITYNDLGQELTVDGPRPGSSDTTTNRYDVAGQLVGIVGPDPDGGDVLQHVAMRYTYNDDGQVTLVENGNVASATESDWDNFAVRTKIATSYDEFGRVETVSQPHRTGTVQHSIAQYSYDLAGRPECVAIRLNAPSTNTAFEDACTPMIAGGFGEDRITKFSYDTVDRVTAVWSAVGTPLEQQTEQRSYNSDGTLAWISDAAGNRTSFSYDGFKRLVRTNFPSPTVANTSNVADYETLTYDPNGNIVTRRSRHDEMFNFTYDALNRLTVKDVPTRAGLAATHTKDVYYEYDLTGALISANFGGASESIAFNYDAHGRAISTTQTMDGTSLTIAYENNVQALASKITHPDGAWWEYKLDYLGRASRIEDDSGVNLITNHWRDWGSQYKRGRDSGAPDEFLYYDDAERLNRAFTDHPSASYDIDRLYSYNPTNQVISTGISNEIYRWDSDAYGDIDVSYAADGLNRYNAVNSTTFSYDANGNLISDGVTTFGYDTENRLVSASGGNTVDLRYDPLGRLYEIKDDAGNITRLLYSGDALIAEYDGGGTMLNRYVHGLAAGDNPLIRYAGAASDRADAEYLYADHLGSIVASFDRNGSVKAINTYDEFGVPGPSSGVMNTGSPLHRADMDS